MKKRDEPFGLHENNFRQEFENIIWFKETIILVPKLWTSEKNKVLIDNLPLCLLSGNGLQSALPVSQFQPVKEAPQFSGQSYPAQPGPLPTLYLNPASKENNKISIVNNFGHPQPSMTAKVLACAESALPIL
jgi:hypothetical protein